jgi:hypothetical protein
MYEASKRGGLEQRTFVTQSLPVFKHKFSAWLFFDLVDGHDFTLPSNYYNGKAAMEKLFTCLNVPFPGGKTLSYGNTAYRMKFQISD